jgi:hypothetical protein
MAFLDNSLAFSTSWSSPQTVTTTADSTNVVDITGAGSGNAPAMINGFPASNTAIGEDYGVGDGVAIPYLYLTVPTTTGGTQTGNVTIAIKAAPDDGAYGQGSYTTLYTSAAIVASTIVAGSTLLVPLPPTLFNFPSEALPRFYKLTYTVSGTMSRKFLAGLMFNPPSNLVSIQYNNNFVVV